MRSARISLASAISANDRCVRHGSSREYHRVDGEHNDKRAPLLSLKSRTFEG